MTSQTSGTSHGAHMTYNDRSRAKLESVPAKSPHRKYLVLLAMHMIHTDDPLVLSEAADCSERTFHYVKSRLSKQDGVIFNYDRSAGRYVVIQSGVLDLARVAELMQRHYPARYAYIDKLSKSHRSSSDEQTPALRRAG
jgi:hypothetical protein